MRGHIAHKRNKYYIVVEIKDDITGERKRKWLAGEDGKGFDRKKDAEKAMPAILLKMKEGVFKPPTQETFGEIMSTYLEDKQSAVKPGTWKSYRWLINTHLIPHLGNKKAIRLVSADFYNLYHKILFPKLAASSIRKLHVLVLDALNRAVAWDMIPRNVALVVELPKGKKPKFEVWNEEQLEKFLDLAKGDQYFIVFELAASTGMRQSEILGLRWQDVDLNSRTIAVRQALTKADKGHEIDDTKNDSSERSIALFADTKSVLEAHKAKHERLKKKPFYKDQGYVIQTGIGTLVNPRNMMRNYYKLIKKSELPPIRFHDLRHTHATILLKNGVHPKIVQERLGHSSIMVTLDTYSHVLPNLQEEVLKGIGSSITGRKNKEPDTDKAQI